MTANGAGTLIAGPNGPLSDAAAALQLERQNAYLKLRCAQLQDDVVNLNAQIIRLEQQLGRLRSRGSDDLASSRP